MKALAQTVPAGHRLRVAISTSYWPMIWPSPELATVTVHEDVSCIELPIVGDVVALDNLFESPQDALPGPVTVIRDGSENRAIVHDLGARRTDFVVSRDDGAYVIDDVGTEQSFTRVRTSSIVDGEPTASSASVMCRATYRRGDWDVRIESDVELTCDVDTFRVVARLAAYDGDGLFAQRDFDRTIPRDHV